MAESSAEPLVSHPPVVSTPPSGPPAIHADRLEVRYRNKVVWRNASFDVQRGEFVAVIGPNGAGKTTLFRMLLGLHWPSAGVLRVFDGAPRRGNPRIGYVPQRHTIDRDTHLECDKLVRLAYPGRQWGPGQRFRPIPWGPRFNLRQEADAAEQALEDVGASDLASKSLGALSGGELQRVFLAEALVGNPDMLLLDEPLSNLDIRRSRELVEVIHRLVQTRGVTTLLVAHDINPMIKCLDKVIYIANGKVATGRPSEVLTSASLTALYGVRVEVLRDSRNNIVIVGGEDDRGEEGA
ncbi:MAG TPA: metal ABC transporter ATP-binding protein [Thermoplasmata archaeon]|nr:metal ABC transporter ATP-binding protein [Thermoplasmata archaeon]